MRRARVHRVDEYSWVDGVMGVLGALGGVAFCLAPVIYLAVR